MDLKDVLKQALSVKASDIILTAGYPPNIRVSGKIIEMKTEPLTTTSVKELIYSILIPAQRERFESDLELDLAYELEDGNRFRVNVHLERGNLAAALRPIPSKIPSLSELNLPKAVEELALEPRGLVLVTGPTGHGKTTTQAAMLEIINTTQKKHIITVEDPIEYLHQNKNSIIEQREVGFDTKSFNTALRHLLRQNPDVILIGEMRDLESISTALTAAETGHLVISTLHTGNSIQAIDRIIDVFPPHQQPQVRIQLSLSLIGVISQQLIPRADGNGRIVAVEIMKALPGVRNLIRKANTAEIYSLIEINKKYGMQTMDNALADLYHRKLITYEEALGHAINPENFEKGLTR